MRGKLLARNAKSIVNHEKRFTQLFRSQIESIMILALTARTLLFKFLTRAEQFSIMLLQLNVADTYVRLW